MRERPWGRYVVVGGFAVRAAGYSRQTRDIDLVVAADPENEARVCDALTNVPAQAVRELDPGDVDRYTVVRVADEIVVDVMKSAGGCDYARAAEDGVHGSS